MNANNFGASGSNFTKLPRDVPRNKYQNLGTAFAGRTPKVWEGKKRPKFGGFPTTLDFDREYLRSGSRYRQTENGVINYNPSPKFEEKDLVKFGPLTKSYRRLF